MVRPGEEIAADRRKRFAEKAREKGLLDDTQLDQLLAADDVPDTQARGDMGRKSPSQAKGSGPCPRKPPDKTERHGLRKEDFRSG